MDYRVYTTEIGSPGDTITLEVTMGYRAYTIEIRNSDDIALLEGIAKLPHTQLSRYGIRGFVRAEQNITSKFKKSFDIKKGAVLANVHVRSENLWELAKNFTNVPANPNIWRLEWFDRTVYNDNSCTIKNVSSIEDNEDIYREDGHIDYYRREWIESILNTK